MLEYFIINRFIHILKSFFNILFPICQIAIFHTEEKYIYIVLKNTFMKNCQYVHVSSILIVHQSNKIIKVIVKSSLLCKRSCFCFYLS